MNHPTDAQLYALAVKISVEADLSQEETEYMKHVAACDDCYHMLCCLMAMIDAAGHIGDLSHRAALTNPAKQAVSAVIRLAVNAVNSVLDQIDAGPESWTFHRAPAALAGIRSGRKRSGSPVKKLTDAGNSRTYVAYDPTRKLLVIQIDGTECRDPYAFLILEDGTRMELTFEKHADLFRTELAGLEEGAHELFLKK